MATTTLTAMGNQRKDKDQWRTLVNRVMKPSGSIKLWKILE
jgi:hypothetical protein